MMPAPVLSAARWRKSTYSNGEGAECLEVADPPVGPVPVRDSKNPTGPVLLFQGPAWSQFIESMAGALPR
ncbi:DUF397 domain-containing protein [Streptomyces sp. NPDC049954]|uniref:DUF397 domain-containing protein n=1 Tax=Streptomyces sp. NPDC049954 TaxID=3155779 RepID=UPI00343A9EC0